jgi:hypothetical protein
MQKKILSILLLSLSIPFITVSCAKSSTDFQDVASSEESLDTIDHNHDHEDADSEADMAEHITEENGMSQGDLTIFGCTRASSSQEKAVDLGLSKKEKFLVRCATLTNNSSWCAQLVRPNPSSYNTFACTYGSSQDHILINPDESTWKYPIEGVNVIKDLAKKGITAKLIYNWWRPEPYNANVGGAAGRHPYGTSIDVRFTSDSMANTAFKELCKMRKAGRIRAIGHYGSASLHIGVGDRTANTWGKSCP